MEEFYYMKLVLKLVVIIFFNWFVYCCNTKTFMYWGRHMKIMLEKNGVGMDHNLHTDLLKLCWNLFFSHVYFVLGEAYRFLWVTWNFLISTDGWWKSWSFYVFFIKLSTRQLSVLCTIFHYIKYTCFACILHCV